MKRYPPERKEAVLKKMLPPHQGALAALAEAEGISEATLYNWRKTARAAGQLLPAGNQTPTGWGTREKFAAVVETAALNEVERAAYCRQHGLYPAQLHQWRQACEQANDWDRRQAQQLKESRQGDARRIKELERELRRKEHALAETAALVVLRKKVQAIWGDGAAE